MYPAEKNLAPKAPEPQISSQVQNVLAEAVLTSDTDKIVLRSKEGWELWSSPTGTQTALQTILKKAKRIYEIRKKRQKK